jgi:hypothetical protein
MKRMRWLGAMLVVCVSIAFLFAGPQVKDKKKTEPDKQSRKCILHDLEIDLSALDALKDLEIKLDALEALHALDLSMYMEGMHEALESLKHFEILDRRELDAHFDGHDFELDFDWDEFDMDFDFDWDDFNFEFDFDFNFDFDWSGFDLDWDWDEDFEQDGSKKAEKKSNNR